MLLLSDENTALQNFVQIEIEIEKLILFEDELKMLQGMYM